MEENYDIFDDYAMGFDMNEKMIAYKYNHSYRVVHQAEEICRSLNMDTVERDLASFIALVHDIARFKQWTEYKTFDDFKSFDHGDEGEKILFDEGLIKKFNVSKEDYDVIRAAVRNHNKFIVEDGLNERELLHTKIVRDADKIDILYAFSTNRLLEIEEDDSPISDEIRDDFMNHRSSLRTKVKGKNDRLLTLVALVYDLNYDYSFQRIKDEKYIEKFFEHVKNKEGDECIVKMISFDEEKKYGNLKGEVKDINGNIIYNIKGNWLDNIKIINKITKEEKIIWEIIKSKGKDEHYFQPYTFDLNNLTEDMKKILPITDSRFRKDLRLIESQNFEEGEKEKFRLEEKQRERRKKNEKEGINPKPKYFEETYDDITGELIYKYKGNYFEDRKNKNFGAQLDIFG